MARSHITVNVHSVAANSAAAENVNRYIIERLKATQRQAYPMGCLYAAGGVIGRPDLTIWRRSTGVRRCIHRFARWLLTL